VVVEGLLKEGGAWDDSVVRCTNRFVQGTGGQWVSMDDLTGA